MRRCLFVLALCFCSSGATCMRLSQITPTIGPRVFSPQPTIQEVIQVVNANTSSIQSLYAPDATFSAPLTPNLRTTLAWERPGRLRLRAETALTGPEIDLGSNDQLFWFWVRRQQPPALFYCRREQYASSAARQIIPVEPDWLIEAIGLVALDPAGQHSGPYDIGGGRLRVQTVLSTPQGPMNKVTLIEAARGWVVEQHWFDNLGNRVASSLMSRHERDPATGVTLPRKIEVHWPATQFQATLDLRTVQLNALGAGQAGLFELPQYPNTPPVDLADPNLTFTPPPTASQTSPWRR